eukprot:TRINITY_DN12901_c0_g1_i1.p1 TRINITY_DN12901_c0_g1~~TRINITY_DN12901_c0_g1_i1.p1  ORF type:complete len:431 (+),score=132.77 TRINITY_DN12901_c0_g1_i1:69-1295(+)
MPFPLPLPPSHSRPPQRPAAGRPSSARRERDRHDRMSPPRSGLPQSARTQRQRIQAMVRASPAMNNSNRDGSRPWAWKYDSGSGAAPRVPAPSGDLLRYRAHESLSTALWLRSIDRELANFSSTSLAAEVILKHLYTEAGWGSPCAHRTACALMLLYRVAGLFGRYTELTRCLLRDVVEAVYVGDGGGMDALRASLADSAADFFAARADYRVEDMLRRELYFNRAFQAEGQALRLRNAALGARCVLERTIDAWTKRTVALTFRCWRTVARVLRLFRRTSLRVENRRMEQLRGLARLCASHRQRGMLLSTMLRVNRHTVAEKRSAVARLKAAVQRRRCSLSRAAGAEDAAQQLRGLLQRWEKLHEGLAGEAAIEDGEPSDGDDETETLAAAVRRHTAALERAEAAVRMR